MTHSGARPRHAAAMGRLAAAAFSAVIIAGCGGATQLPAQSRPSPIARLVGGPPRHVAVIVMENEEYGEIIGSRSAPYINELARGSALAGQMYAVAHPSLPNYLALTGGSTSGITTDCTDCTVKGSGLAGQLTRRGLSWKAYMEDLPHACYRGAGAGEYAKKHDPFIYYDAVAGNQAQCQHIVPLTELTGDEAARRLPRFIWITPNLCHDMHDCSQPSGDRFLAGVLPRLIRTMGARSLVILTFDEGSSDDGCCGLAHGGHIVTILAGSAVRPGFRLRTPVDHFSVLQTIEDMFGLARLGAATCPCTPSLAPALKDVGGTSLPAPGRPPARRHRAARAPA